MIHKTPSIYMLSKGFNSNILGTVWCVKLEITGLGVRDVNNTLAFLRPEHNLCFTENNRNFKCFDFY